MVNLATNSSARTRIGAMHLATWGVALRAGGNVFAFSSPVRYNATMREGRNRPPVYPWRPARAIGNA